jgi:hypothetical protein
MGISGGEPLPCKKSISGLSRFYGRVCAHLKGKIHAKR